LGIGSIVELENSVVNTRKVACARRLVLLRRKGEAIAIDVLTERTLFSITENTAKVGTNTRETLVMLVALNLTEVVGITNRETVMTIELKESSSEGITTAGIRARIVEPVSRTIHRAGISTAMVASSMGPDEFLDGVVKVEGDVLVSGVSGDSLSASKLDLFNEVFVANLGETTTLISIEINVIYIKLAGKGTNRGARTGLDEVSDRAKLKVKLNLMILESNEGKSKTRVAVEPELKRNIKTVIDIIGIENTNLLARGSKSIANHVVITGTTTSGDSEFSPDIHPITILTVNELTTNLNLSLLNHSITNTISPGSTGTSTSDSGGNTLEIHLLNKVTITRNGSSNTLAKIYLTVESLFNRLNGKVSMTAIYHLKEGNLRVSSEINILGAIGYKLH